MAQVYPWSRISMRNCPMCRTQQGKLGLQAPVTFTTEEGQAMKLLRVACDGCGYTMLFDPSVMNDSPYQGGDDELPPTIGAG